MNRGINTPEIKIGVFSGKQISFSLNGIYREESINLSLTGTLSACCDEEKIYLRKDNQNLVSAGGLLLKPVLAVDSSFTLHAVTIGVDFHWERKEDQTFKGDLKLIIENGNVTAINILSIEDYLISVISSEMKATSSVELLKAHAVISRSWLLAQIEKSKTLGKGNRKYETHFSTENELIRWYDREDHKNYDVCADDHCQRYQGISRVSVPAVEQVIKETYGEVLTFEGAICDSRYYKCCGGITELFENVWEPVHHPYLRNVTDNQYNIEGVDLNMNREEVAAGWILGNPEAFCNTHNKEILSQVLNDYDQETSDFFRWKVSYTQSELSELIKLKTGIDFGMVTDLIALERGTSGRIVRLRIEGTRKTMTIGKELEIRKALSKTHLYSSCFITEKTVNQNETYFIIHGAGWGHGVGLCQIGAAVMGSKGYSYNDILLHYFRSATIEKIY